ncbi:hypothetical protein SDC9_91066 [bioreactor metagenome]|uniref:Uncharacterized protein n=1 Tax=bioreactor metagenome TaxID=1076179 RepID=A0A644ZVC9_9ZZZZ
MELPGPARRCGADPEVGRAGVGHAGDDDPPDGGLAFDRGDRQQFAPVPRDVRGGAYAVQDALQPGDDVVVVVEAQHVGLRQLRGEVGAVPLGHAADRDDSLCAALGLQVGRLQQHLHGLLLRLGDEPAGVHHHRVGTVGLVDEPEAPLGQPGRQLLGIDVVACTAQGDQVHRQQV